MSEKSFIPTAIISWHLVGEPGIVGDCGGLDALADHYPVDDGDVLTVEDHTMPLPITLPIADLSSFRQEWVIFSSALTEGSISLRYCA